jgi:hypothetical protein
VSETAHTFAVGDRVICNPAETSARFHGTVWTVEKINRVNVTLHPINGGRGLRIHPSALLPAPTADQTATAVDVAYPPPLSIGAVVTVASPRWKGTDDLHVVLRDTIDTLQLAVLGGNNNRVWSKVPRGWVTEVSKAALLDAVTGLRRPA